MVAFKDRRRQAEVDARNAAKTEKMNTVPEGHELIPEDQWDAHEGQKVYAKGIGQRKLTVSNDRGYPQYFVEARSQGRQITKGNAELYKKASKQ